MTEEKEYYTARQAAKYLGIPMHRLARLRRQGRIKSVVEDSDARYATYHIDQIKRVDVSDLRRKKDEDKGNEDAAPHRWDSCLPGGALARVG